MLKFTVLPPLYSLSLNWRIDAFELWCWRRLLRVPWTSGRSNQSILKEISPGCSLEGLMLKLKLQYLGHLMWRVDSLEKTLMLGGIEGRRRRGWQDEMAGWHHRIDGREFEWTLGVGDGQGGLACCSPWDHKESDTTDRLNWTELNHRVRIYLLMISFNITCSRGLKLEYLIKNWLLKHFDKSLYSRWAAIKQVNMKSLKKQIYVYEIGKW